MQEKPLVLILCTGNSCRSHLAEGILRQKAGDLIRVESAGSKPAGFVHPLAVRAMKEIGIDISGHRSKHLEEFLDSKPHTVITVCGNVDQACPIFPGMMKRYHWGFDDPAKATGTEEEIFAVFRRVRDEIGIELEIISTAEEARLVVTGCAPLLHPRLPYALVFDIGGGSTEIVWLRQPPGRHGPRGLRAAPEILGSVSLPFGVVTFTERFGGIEVSPAIYRAMVAEAEAALLPFEREFGIRREVRARQVQMLGSSGTVTTLAGVHLALPRYIRAFVDGSMLTFDQIELVSRHLAGLDIEGRAANPCVGRERADLVLSGCAILDAICATWPVGRLRVADRGIREGILFELMQGAPE